MTCPTTGPKVPDSPALSGATGLAVRSSRTRFEYSPLGKEAGPVVPAGVRRGRRCRSVDSEFFRCVLWSGFRCFCEDGLVAEEQLEPPGGGVDVQEDGLE